MKVKLVHVVHSLLYSLSMWPLFVQILIILFFFHNARDQTAW